MPKAPPASTRRTPEKSRAQVRAYLAALPPDARRHLERLGQVIRSAVPNADEAFSYGMPAIGLEGSIVLHYAAWKHHSSIYPVSQATARALSSELAGYDMSGKGTIRFAHDAPIPATLVRRLVKARIAEWRAARLKKSATAGGAAALAVALALVTTPVVGARAAIDREEAATQQGGAAPQRPPREPSVEMAVTTPPVVVNVGGTPTLVHEVHITNMRRDPIAIDRLRVHDAESGAPVADLAGQALTTALVHPGRPRGAPDPHIVAPGQRVVAYLWSPLGAAGRAPGTLTHQVDLTIEPGAAGRAIQVEGPGIRVDNTPPVVLGPPLSGGPWVAIYDPELMGGHRTALFTLDGRARIPARFAIDWIRAPETAAKDTAPRAESLGPNGYGASVLAVTDAVVATVMDDMPDHPPERSTSTGPMPLEQGSGNYVILDLGQRRFAVYEHLKQGSIAVKAGQRVRRGDRIAQLGSSGSSSMGPHLHFHVADANDTLAAEGQPWVFAAFEHLGAYESIGAVLKRGAWIPAAGGAGGARRLQHPASVSVIRFQEPG